MRVLLWRTRHTLTHIHTHTHTHAPCVCNVQFFFFLFCIENRFHSTAIWYFSAGWQNCEGLCTTCDNAFHRYNQIYDTIYIRTYIVVHILCMEHGRYVWLNVHLHVTDGSHIVCCAHNNTHYLLSITAMVFWVIVMNEWVSVWCIHVLCCAVYLLHKPFSFVIWSDRGCAISLSLVSRRPCMCGVYVFYWS